MASTRIPPLNERIRELAKLRGVDRGDLTVLATKCGTRRNAPSTWVSGSVTPEPKHWGPLADYLGVDQTEFQMIAAEFFAPGITQKIKALGRSLQKSERERRRLADLYKRSAKATSRTRPRQPAAPSR